MNLCEEIGILKVTLLLKNIFQILIIVIPLILIVMIMIDLFKIVIGVNNNPRETVSTIFKRFIAAVVVFVIPTVVFSLFGILLNNINVANDILCIEKATSENIKNLELALDAKKEAERKENERKQQEYLNSVKQPIGNSNNNQKNDNKNPVSTSNNLTPFVNGTQRALKTGDCMSARDSCSCPTIGKFKGFYFKMASATGRNMKDYTGGDTMTTVKVACSDGTYISKTVNSKAQSNFKSAFEKICKLKTTGISGIKLPNDMLRIDGTLVRRTTSSRTICSPHAYGIAIDINYDLTINVNGRKYKPYASQGFGTKKAYDEFVNALGNEYNIRNVNYILWKYAFEPSGFVWGGNWSDGDFDPMHFEVIH